MSFDIQTEAHAFSLGLLTVSGCHSSRTRFTGVGPLARQEASISNPLLEVGPRASTVRALRHLSSNRPPPCLQASSRRAASRSIRSVAYDSELLSDQALSLVKCMPVESLKNYHGMVLLPVMFSGNPRRIEHGFPSK